MRQKLNLIVKVVLFCMLVCFISCEREESLINNQELAQEKTQTEKIKDAEKWFNAYKTSSKTGKSAHSEINKAFQNIDYYWENADIISFENDSTAVVVPIKDSPENPNYKGQKMLYLYPSDSKYQSVIQEIFPDSEESIDDNQKREGFENLDAFSGYIITWDLKGNFINGARFKNNKLLNRIQARFISSEYAVSKPNSSTSKEKPPIFLDEVIVFGGSGGPSNPIGIKNDFSIGSKVGGGIEGYLKSPTGGGGAIEGNNSIANKIIVVGPSKIIANIQEYLKCFDSSKGGQLIIYVDQPKPNNSDAYTLEGDVGHTFIAIQQGDIRRVIGYWPTTSVNPVTSPTDKKAFGNDENHYFDVSVSTTINASQLGSIIGYCKNNVPATYNLNTYNCTDFGLAIGRLGGLNFGDSSGTWPGGGGNNPGQLGQNIRNMTLPANSSRQTTGGNAGANKGICN